MAGNFVYSGGSGPVLSADLLATYVFEKADSLSGESTSGAAVDWLLKVLGTCEADGIFKVAVWGLSIDEQTPISDSLTVMPFETLADSYMKRRILERARGCYDGSIWLAHNYFDKPGAAFTKRVPKFPYIGADGASFKRISELQKDARDFWLLVQAASVGRTLAICSWFEYEDESLDFNNWQNSLAWILPEIQPRISMSTEVTGKTIRNHLKEFDVLPENLRARLVRSMERFELSQCRRAVVDRVLDLALAFEIAVSGPGPNTPVSWKVSVRCAQLIGGTVSERAEIRDAVQRLYSLRNKATHGSDIAKRDAVELNEAISSGVTIYQKMIVSFLAFGFDPEWGLMELQARTPG